MGNTNVYDMVNNKIMELLEAGTVPWHKPWQSTTSMPKNLISKKGYRGVNLFMLACQPYSSPYWLTYKQTAELGGHVKKGEKSTPVIFWKMLDMDDTASDKATGKIPLLRYYSVFNADQCEDITTPPIEEASNPFTPIETAENIILGMPMLPEIKYGGGRAYYSPTLDYIQLPKKTAFDSVAEYYNTLFHECCHASGHAKRLARKSMLEPSYFGSHEYSKEELVAETGAAFLCGHAGIENCTIENSAAYIQGWLRALKGDRTLLVHAAAQGHKAADYILNVQPEELEADA
jgi:antirestriction protein ArdC